jgi:hypothetical protein
VDGDEELAGPARLPRLASWAAAVAGVVAAAVIAVQLADGAGTGGGTRPAPSPSTVGSWPSANSRCGSGLLPVVSAQPVRSPATGITVLLGGQRVDRVSFDSGDQTTVDGIDPTAAQSVTQLRGGSTSYAILSGCDPLTDLRLIRISGQGTTSVATIGLLSNVILDGDDAWAVLSGGSSTIPDTLQSLDGRPPVTVPRGFTPLGIAGSKYVGEQLQPGPLLGEDPPTVQVRDLDGGDTATRLGRGQVIAVTRTGVLWLEPCSGIGQNGCTLHYALVGAAQPAQTFRLPPGDVPTARGVVSPDGHQIAFPVQGSIPDARYPSDAPPTHVVVLDLPSGALTTVPGVELPAAPVPGLALSDRGWLILALNNGPSIRLLAWRPGLRQPLESHPVHSAANGRPPVVIVAGG